MLLGHWEVTVVIEMVVGEEDSWEVHKVGKVVKFAEIFAKT